MLHKNQQLFMETTKTVEVTKLPKQEIDIILFSKQNTNTIVNFISLTHSVLLSHLSKLWYYFYHPVLLQLAYLASFYPQF